MNSRKPIKSSQAKLHSDNMEDVRERLENTVTQSSVETLYDGEDCFITVTQKNYETGNNSEWSFVVDFGTNKVQMLEPVEDEEGFTSDNEIYRIIKNFLNSGTSREKRMNRPDYDSGEPIKVTGKGNKIGNSRQSSMPRYNNEGKVWSDSLGEYVWEKVRYKDGDTYHWDDINCLYWNDNSDESDYLMITTDDNLPRNCTPIKNSRKPIKSSNKTPYEEGKSAWGFFKSFGTKPENPYETKSYKEGNSDKCKEWNKGFNDAKNKHYNINNSRKAIKSSLSDVNKALGFTDNDVEEDGRIHITTDFGEFVVDYVNDKYIVTYDGEERTFTEYKDTVDEVVNLFNQLCNEEIKLFNENINSSRKLIKESFVRCVTFEQIVDSRFDDISKGKEILNQRRNKIISLCGNDFTVLTDDIRFLDFGDNESQYRQRYYIRKNNNNVTWNDLYKIVNSVKAVPYKFDKINDFVFESRKPIKSAKTICRKGSAKLIEHCEAGEYGYLGRYTIIIDGKEVYNFTAENRPEAVCSFNNYLDYRMNYHINNSRKPIKSSKSVCIGFNTENGTLLWKRDDLYTLDGSSIRQTKQKDIADKWIEKYNLNTTDTEQLDKYTQEGIGQIPWGLPLVEDKGQINHNKKLASILPPHNVNSSYGNNPLPTEKDYRDFVDKLNNYCKNMKFSYGPMYEFEYEPEEGMSNDGWGHEYPNFRIYDTQGNLDMFSDDSIVKYIRNELKKKGWYPEAVHSSSDFTIAVE